MRAMTSWRELATLPVGVALRRGVGWWLRTLASLLPEGVRRLPARWRRELRLIERDGRLELVVAVGGETIVLGRMILADGADGGGGASSSPVPSSPSASSSPSSSSAAPSASAAPEVLAAELRALIERHPHAVDRVVLVVDPRLTLVRDFTLPRAALADPRGAAELEIDRLTPFRADDVLFAVRPLAVLAGRGAKGGGAGATDEAPFRLVLTPGARLAPLFVALERAGLRLDHVDLAGLKAPASRVCPSLAPRVLRWRVAAALAGAAVLLLAVWLPVQQRARLATEKEREARMLAPQAAEVAALARSAAAIVERERWLVAEKRDRLTMLGLLDEVSRAMPDDAFVLQFVQAGERLDLTGYAEKAARLVALLGEAPHLSEPRFTAPVTLDRRLGRERYSLELKIRARRLDEGAGDAEASASVPTAGDRGAPSPGRGVEAQAEKKETREGGGR